MGPARRPAADPWPDPAGDGMVWCRDLWTGSRGGTMDYGQFVKKLDLPPGFAFPARLTHDDIVARAISRADLSEDVRGINASIEIIRRTRGGSWPAEEVTEEFNFVDLVWHECEFREGDSFAYAVYDVTGHYTGLYRALRQWLAENLPFREPYFSNREIPPG